MFILTEKEVKKADRTGEWFTPPVGEGFEYWVAHHEPLPNAIIAYSIPYASQMAKSRIVPFKPEDIPSEALRTLGVLNYAGDTGQDVVNDDYLPDIVFVVDAPYRITSVYASTPYVIAGYFLAGYNARYNILYTTDWPHHKASREVFERVFFPWLKKELEARGYFFKSPTPAPSSSEPITQKAMGFVALAKRWDRDWAEASSGFVVMQDEAEAEEAFRLVKPPVFARPCPTFPRHGFVESREVSNPEELAALFREARAADPQAEVIVMQKKNARVNAIITPQGITLGRGHDGATSGKGAIFLPIPPGKKVLPQPAWSELLREGEVEYVEAVHDGVRWSVVQYRSGPPIPTNPDYIPEKMVVKEVYHLNSDMDLLEWEEVVKNLPRGTAVYHPGGSLASHYGVHCVASGVPYITSHEPKVGETLIPKSGWDKDDLADLARYMGAWWQLYEDGENAMPLALGLVHSIALLLNARPSEATKKLLAWGVVNLARYALGASLGELRYSPRRGRLTLQLGITLNGADRDDIYYAALGYNLSDTLIALHIAKKDFAQGGWSPNFGGRKWASSTGAALGYAKAIARFMARPTKRGLNALVKAANRLLHVAHNNGWYLDKWTNPTPFHAQNTAAEDPAALVIMYPELIMDLVKVNLGEVDHTQMGQSALKRLEEYSEGEGKMGAVEKFKEALASKKLSTKLVKKLMQDPQFAQYWDDLVKRVLNRYSTKPPYGWSKVYARHTPLWNGSYHHIQVQLPINKGRSYGGVIDISSEDDEDLREFLAVEWALTSPHNKPSLNSADSVKIYAEFEEAWWDGDNELIVKVGPVMLLLPKAWR